MSISRRKFLKAGTIAALAAGVPLPSALIAAGQDLRKDRDGNPIDPYSSGNDPLPYYTIAAFSAYLNSTFWLSSADSGTVAVNLVRVVDLLSQNDKNQVGRECFSLLFRGSGPDLSQDTYPIVHDALGSFSLLLVPGGPDSNGERKYLAIINRLPGSAAFIAAPSSTGKRRRSPVLRSQVKPESSRLISKQDLKSMDIRRAKQV